MFIAKRIVLHGQIQLVGENRRFLCFQALRKVDEIIEPNCKVLNKITAGFCSILVSDFS